MRNKGDRRPRPGGTAAACMWAIGVLVAAAVMPAISPAPARASCASAHTNVAGWDAAANRYGNGGEIYVNTSSTLGSLQSSVFRSLFDAYDTGNDVEVGWTDNNGGHQVPTVYAEWLNRGVDSGPQFYTGYSLNYDTNYNFKVQNDGHLEIFRFYVDGQTTPLNYSPTMDFNLGAILTNSEHYNTCDSLWTHMYDLSYFNSAGNWVSGYGNLQEYSCNSGGNWLLSIRSNSELYVDQTTGVC